MKILHTSDWHLGMSFRGINIEEDQKHFINEICNIISNEKVELVIISGDVFDRSVAHPNAIKLYDETVTRICQDMGVPVCIVAGNHDGAERLASCNVLLRKSGLYVKGVLSKNLEPVSVGDVDVYMLPWITTEKVRAVFEKSNEEIRNLEEAYMYVCQLMRESFVSGRKNILVAHAFIVNAETSVSDRAAEVGFATAIGSSVFEGFDYVALGHIHGPQNIGDNIRYCGTPMAYSFGKEEKQNKGVTVIDTASMNRKEISIIPFRDRKTIKGKFEDIIKASNMSERDRDAYVRIEIEDIYVGLEVLTKLKEMYPNMLEIVGKTYDSNDSKITMSIEELESKANSPTDIFERYYEDTYGESPSNHLRELFLEAVKEFEGGEE